MGRHEGYPIPIYHLLSVLLAGGGGWHLGLLGEEAIPCRGVIAVAVTFTFIKCAPCVSSRRSLATYDDVLSYFNSKMLKDAMKPTTKLGDVMHTRVFACGPEDNVDELKGSLAIKKYGGLPVVDNDGKLVGVVSKTDWNTKEGDYVHEVMSTPPVAAKRSDNVTAAACLMLKYKVGRIPVVDDEKHCVGMVTRNDVFTVLAVDSGNEKEILNIDM